MILHGFFEKINLINHFQSGKKMNKIEHIVFFIMFTTSLFFLSSCGNGLIYLMEMEDDVNPSPGKVKITGVSSTISSFTLNWIDPIDDDLDHIRVNWDSDSQDIPVGTETLTVTGLPSDTVYPISAVSVDSSGKESTVLLSAKTVDGLTYYIIDSAAELDAVRNDLDGYHIITNDVDLSGYSSWAPIGDNANRFTGILEGGGNIITGLTINAASNDLGLFSYIDGATIKNVNIDGFNITGNTSIGSLAGKMYNGSVIDNCHVRGDINGINYIGGLIGMCDNINYIRKSSAHITISLSGLGSGGLAAHFHGDISDSYARGSITNSSTGQSYGGLIGLITTITDNTVTNSYASVAVSSAGSTNLGGMLGFGLALPVFTSTFYDRPALQVDNGYGTNESTSAMKLQSTYSDWDFTGTWAIDPLINDGYPSLRSNPLY